mmetsp:Transcript_164376/g.522661  ORF Transcript_164376/g.522661 Transcript_164376/m.522661 type:complete len:85 (-) Transcript_164376:95-349(-)
MTRSQSQLAAVQATKGFQRLVEHTPKILAEILAKAPCEEGQSMGSRSIVILLILVLVVDVSVRFASLVPELECSPFSIQSFCFC